MILPSIDAKTAKQKLDAGEALLIDVREADEHAREHIAAARLVPLSALAAQSFGAETAKIAIFHCKSGMRTQTNAARLRAAGLPKPIARRRDRGLERRRAAGEGQRQSPA